MYSTQFFQVTEKILTLTGISVPAVPLVADTTIAAPSVDAVGVRVAGVLPRAAFVYLGAVELVDTPVTGQTLADV